MKEGHYIQKSLKLEKQLAKYLNGFEPVLIEKYGQVKSKEFIANAKSHYPDIVTKIPFFSTPMYDSLIVLNSRMMALKKGMNDVDIGVEEFVGLQVENLRAQTQRILQVIKNLMGKIYLSRLFRLFLKGVGKSASKNGWPTQVIDGQKGDDFSMKIETKKCQMVDFMCAVGEDDMKPYCTFADFTTAETLGLGLKQIATIDSGTCAYCLSKKGKAEWPALMQTIIDKTA